MKRTIHFTKIRWVMIAISTALILAGIATTIARGGFNLGIDFQAGLEMQVEISGQDVPIEAVREALSTVEGTQVQSVGPAAAQRFSIQVQDTGEIENFSVVTTELVLDSLRGELGSANVLELGTAYVGPRFSTGLAQQAILLTAFALLLILVYIWFRFRLTYASASILTLVHDIAFMLGFIGALQLEVSTATIAAVLTIIGYSLNDTIVVFDRIRENETLLRDSSFESVINTSITQSLSRTLITSVTTLLAVLSIYIFATGQIQAFALNLIVGIIIGTYSSVFIASPALLGFQRTVWKRRRKKELEQFGSASERRVSPEAERPAGGEAPQKETSAREAEAVKEAIAKKRSASKPGEKQKSRAQRKKKK
jgi:preprotein translocase subunit SecF